MSRRRKGKRINGWLIVDKPSGDDLDRSGRPGQAPDRGAPRRAMAAHSIRSPPASCRSLSARRPRPSCTSWTRRSATGSPCASASRDNDRRQRGRGAARPATAAPRCRDRGALPAFTGPIMQGRPTSRRSRSHGERAYDLARRGETVELAPSARCASTSSTLLERPDADHAVFEAACGKGAYVRALARDLGERLGCFGHVVALRRLQVGPFGTERAVTLDALAEIVEDDSSTASIGFGLDGAGRHPGAAP